MFWTQLLGLQKANQDVQFYPTLKQQAQAANSGASLEALFAHVNKKSKVLNLAFLLYIYRHKNVHKNFYKV